MSDYVITLEVELEIGFALYEIPKCLLQIIPPLRQAQGNAFAPLNKGLERSEDWGGDRYVA